MNNLTIEQCIERVENAIKAVYDVNKNNGTTKLTEEIFRIPGMSTRENRILLNELVKEGDKYFEIGVHKGSTFISAMYKNNAQGVAIDNFSQFGNLQECKPWFDQACKDHGIENITFIDEDCFKLNSDQKSAMAGANIYFYDGDHRSIDQEMALTYYFKELSNPVIFIVDDWNHFPAKVGTRKGIDLTGAIVHKEWELDSDKTEYSWHNGLYVAVLGKP